MNIEEMKKKLRNFRYLQVQIQDIESEIKSIRESQDGLRDIGAVTYSDMPKEKNNNDKISDAVCRIIDVCEKRIIQRSSDIEVKLKELQIIQELLWTLEEKEYNVIMARYIDKICWDFIPGKLHYSRRQCFYLHDKAIIKLLNEYEKRLH